MKLLKNIFQKSRSKEDGIFFNEIQTIIGFKPQSINYYQKAFTHRSTNQLDLKGNPEFTLEILHVVFLRIH